MMIRFLISLAITAFIAVSIGLLSGCSTDPAQSAELVAQRSAPLLTGFATLADSGDQVDMAAAPVYTRLALYRKRAATYLGNGLITIAQAKQSQATADSIRSQLDSARAAGKVPIILGLSHLLDLAINSLESQT
jgi:hypothetical protein